MQGNRTMLFVLLFMLLIGGMGFIYVYLLQPVQAELEQVKAERKNEEQLVEKMMKQRREQEDLLIASSHELQRQLPVAPLTDQFLLQMEELFGETNHLLESMQLKVNVQEVEPWEESLTEESSEETDREDEANLPALIHRISMEMHLRTVDYLSMEDFLTKLEELERIVLIDSLEFRVSDREREDISHPFQYTLSLSIFYVQDLEELMDELPEAEFLKPAEKRVPVWEKVGTRLEKSLLPAVTEKEGYYIVQAGAYRTPEGAERAATHLQERGWPTYIQVEIPPNRVYIGMATQREEAYRLGEWYRTQGQEVYVRSLAVDRFPGKIGGLGDEEHALLSQLLKNCYELSAYLSHYSIAQLTGSTVLPDRSAELSQELKWINQWGNILNSHLDQSQVEALTKLLTELNSGVYHYMLHQETGAQEALRKIQEHLLNYTLLYERWLREG